ncbi:MAG TPA: cyclic lactone autoinducer peptide [Bacilli bacterium]
MKSFAAKYASIALGICAFLFLTAFKGALGAPEMPKELLKK